MYIDQTQQTEIVEIKQEKIDLQVNRNRDRTEWEKKRKSIEPIEEKERKINRSIDGKKFLDY